MFLIIAFLLGLGLTQGAVSETAQPWLWSIVVILVLAQVVVEIIDRVKDND